jgi:integrase
MKIFLSWSGPVSRDVARALKGWIKLILAATKPWMSEDTEKGKLWFGEISKEIKDSRYGVICVTAQNRTAPWLLWEAGALYGGFDREQIVVPLLINLSKAKLGQPLSAFQAIEAKNKDEVTHWLKAMNKRLGDLAIDEDQVDKYIDVFWQELQDAIAKAINDNPIAASKGAEHEHTFKDAAEVFMRHLKEKKARSITRYQQSLDQLEPYLYHLPLSQVDEHVLSPFIKARLDGSAPGNAKKKSVRAMPGTVRKDLDVVRQVLQRAVKLGWLDRVPFIQSVDGASKQGHTLTWEEQEAVFGYIPDHAKGAYLFAVNTGLRKAEIVKLRWDQFREEKGVTYFVVPVGWRRGITRPVVLNSIARQVIEEQKGKNAEFVFTTRKNKQYTGYGTRDWNVAWKRAGMPTGKLINVGCDNLRKTFEYRLAVAGVSPQDVEILRGSTKAEIYERGVPPPVDHLAKCLEKITVPTDGAIAQTHGKPSKLNKGKWFDKRKLKGRRVKGQRLGESAPIGQMEIPGA